jgi:hypothetical protein
MMTGRYKWLNLYPNQNPPTNPFNFTPGENMYFRFRPEFIDWGVLILMHILMIVNTMFKQKAEIDNLREKTNANLKDQYAKASYYYNRVETIAKSLLIYTLLIFMIYVQTTIETNLINWVFYVLNSINFAFIVRGVKKIGYLKQSLAVSNMIKIYSLLVMVIDIIFICFIGEFEKPNQPDSLDQKFKRAYPNIYNQLDMIGFRTNTLEVGTIVIVQAVGDMQLKSRFIAYVE